MTQGSLPLLPLVLADVPPALSACLTQEGISWCRHREQPLDGRVVLFDRHRERPPEVDRRQVLIDVHRIRQQLRCDPFQQWSDARTGRGWWKIGPLSVSEEVAAVDKAAIRSAMLGSLRGFVEEAGGVWFRLSRFPYPYRSAFSLRIDYDEYHAEDVAATLAALAGHEDCTSHYICGASYEAQSDALRTMRGLDVGGHGYFHHTYPDRATNVRNIERGFAVLRQAGIEPAGFVAPHGRYTPGLAEALAELRVSHSSEFGLAYDDLPFWPPGSPVLQIPCHPVCLGSFLQAAGKADNQRARDEAADIATAYFTRLVRARYLAGDPVIIYGHPTRRLGQYPQLLHGVLGEAVQSSAMWRTTLRTINVWWRARSKVALRLWRDGDELSVETDHCPAKWRLGGELLRGSNRATVPLETPSVRFQPGALVFEKPAASQSPRPLRIDRGESLRGRVRRWVDWEYVTPLNEIDRSTWRGWIKHSLRRAKSNGAPPLSHIEDHE